jgi:triosephosphate isomerase
MQKQRKFFIGANWKMHGTRALAKELAQGIATKAHILKEIDMVIFPSDIFIPQVSQSLERTPIAIGGQNIASELAGAYTGETSGAMLQEFGCHYVLIGHSERRVIFAEDNELIATKFYLSQSIELKPILCVGETLAQRDQGKAERIVAEQLAFLQPKHLARGVIIAYEPVWAIGTGKTATPEQAQAMHHFIRMILTEVDNELAAKIRIIYGGSVKANNATSLFAMPDIDGALVGGASLQLNEFLDICQQACNQAKLLL